MRVAIIDLGTNSVRFDVHSLEKGKAKLLYREKQMIRLGQGVFVKGRMDPAAIERAVAAFGHFERIAGAYGVRKIVAFGTSALREAQDSAALVEAVKSRTGIELKVISGQEEAKLIAQGIHANERPPSGRYALVDIGGGSTEISICRGKKILESHSFELGTARLQQVFLRKSPPKEKELQRLREYIRNILGQRMRDWPGASQIMGSSGTVRAAAKILGEKEDAFPVEELAELVEDMAQMNTSQLLDIPDMEAKRVDMILAGTLLLEEICYMLGAKTVIPTEFSLRDGVIDEEIRLSRAHKSSLLELHLDDLYTRAVRFGANEKHLHHMTELASALFVRLRPLHKLDAKWKVYLLSAVILRNAGELVGFAGKEKHSYYIVKNADFPSMQSWEHEFIARLCLFHAGGKVERKDLEPLGKEKKRRDAFLRLLPILRIVDALDLGPRTELRLKKTAISRNSVKLSFSGKASAGIEELVNERRKKLFEEEFGRQLVLERLKKG